MKVVPQHKSDMEGYSSVSNTFELQKKNPWENLGAICHPTVGAAPPTSATASFEQHRQLLIFK